MAGESSTNRMVGAIVQIRIANIEFGTVFDYPLKHEWRACNLSPRSPSDCQVQLSLPKTCTGCMLLLSAAWRKRYGNAKTLNSMGSATRCKHSGSSPFKSGDHAPSRQYSRHRLPSSGFSSPNSMTTQRHAAHPQAYAVNWCNLTVAHSEASSSLRYRGFNRHQNS